MASSEPLVVKIVDLHEKANATQHRTCAYDLVHLKPPTPVLRRGQPIKLGVSFDRPYVDTIDIVRLVFNFGRHPNVMKGTRGINTITDRCTFLPDRDIWNVRIIDSNADGISAEVRTPVDSPVGIWRLTIETNTLGSEKVPNIYEVNKDIYLLFNPWLKEDIVYMENERLLDEYISNDTGKIWVGDNRSCRGREWVFGQFDDCVLPACQFMLERSGIRDSSRGDPIKMSRVISKMVNSNDDQGVLTGRWNGGCSDGIAPAAWTGSVPILEQFLKTGNQVKYGQCWVFAGVVTTVCRALGIPARPVTNISSAHDQDASLSIDYFYNSQTDKFHTRDSIWNYHVWNDVWMARPDLPKGYGGWQAIDATPQETSDGFYQCGPSSVEAIKRGAVGYNYDVAFMLATVNADVMHWVKDVKNDLGWKRIQCNTWEVGRMILTKVPFMFDPNGDRDREDITECYKNKEGTPEERSALHRAARSLAGARRPYAILDLNQEDVKFELVLLDRVKIGESFTLTVHIQNTSAQPRSIHANLWIKSVYYNGVNAKLIKEETSDCVLQPGEREDLRLAVPAEEYLDKLVEYSMMKLCAIATVKETNQVWTDEDDFQVLNPIIVIETTERLMVGKEGTVVLTFTNPLKKVLTGCTLNYSGPGLEKNMRLPVANINSSELVRVRCHVVPQKAGQQHVVATFTSDQFVDITGSATLDILEKEVYQ